MHVASDCKMPSQMLSVKVDMEQMALGSSNEMFAAYPAFLPVLTDGETLFSWAARYHRLSGNALAKQSSIQLFCDRRAGLRPDFPSHLQQLVEITRGLIGDAETLAYERTIFGFFAPFQDAQGASNVLAQMRGTSVEKVKSVLGLVPSRLGAFFPMKFCQDCMRDDLREDSVSRWHLEHQWSSVWICRKHHKMLHILQRDSQSRDLRRWLLPEDLTAEEWTTIPVRNLSAIKSKLIWIAELSAYFAQLRGQHFDHQLLRYSYLLQAKNRGWLYTDGSVRLALVRPLFLKYYCEMENIPGYEVVKGVQTEHAGMLGLLMRQFDWRRHPVKHILLIAFLFDSVVEFGAVYEQVRQTHMQGGLEAIEDLVGESWKLELKRLVEVERKSLSAAASIIGIPLCVAIRVARQEGIAYQRRERVVNTNLGEKILEMTSQGYSLLEILQKTGIKKSLLKDLMARNPALRDAWRKKDFERRKETYRVNFLELIKQFSGAPIKKLRTVPGNGVSWLYRNDREWLVENLPCMWRG